MIIQCVTHDVMNTVCVWAAGNVCLWVLVRTKTL